MLLMRHALALIATNQYGEAVNLQTLAVHGIFQLAQIVFNRLLDHLVFRNDGGFDRLPVGGNVHADRTQRGRIEADINFLLRPRTA